MLCLNLALRLEERRIQVRQPKVLNPEKFFFFQSPERYERNFDHSLPLNFEYRDDEKLHKPELDIEVGTNKEGTNMVTNETVGSFDWSILMRGIGSSWMDFIVVIGEDVEDLMFRI